jgi:hypothetical protein
MRSLILIFCPRVSWTLLPGRYPKIYRLRNSVPIFAAVSSKPFRFSPAKARPPLNPAISLNYEGLWSPEALASASRVSERYP